MNCPECGKHMVPLVWDPPVGIDPQGEAYICTTCKTTWHRFLKPDLHKKEVS